MPFTWVTIRSGRSTPADLVQSRFSQIGPRSVSELESVLTLLITPIDVQNFHATDKGGVLHISSLSLMPYNVYKIICVTIM